MTRIDLLSNPMTTAEDIIVGGASGVPERLAAGSEGDVLTIDSGAVAWAAPAGGGVLRQFVTGSSSSDDTTSSTTLQNSSLSLAITPTASDSVLVIQATGAAEFRATGSTADRFGWIALYNSTNSVELCEYPIGRSLVSANTTAAACFEVFSIQHVYTVNSTAARTFVLQYRASGANQSAVIKGTRDGGARMFIWEYAP